MQDRPQLCNEYDIDALRRLSFVREEIRFEMGLLHNRANALIGAEAFLTIAFTTAMSNVNTDWGPFFTLLVPTTLAVIGIILAVISRPGIRTSLTIIAEWNVRQREVMVADAPLTRAMWRHAVLVNNYERPEPEHRSMMFFQLVPMVFIVSWTVLLSISLALQLS
ncbi:hypothetical protein ACFOD4_07970 [Pseudoroseomonas globiformis]|uniref:Uncharacterized protein n=1 Tax=Teichococcus globiformis TaxID=2307229 RepID=A0ABV7FZE8_9PROT